MPVGVENYKGDLSQGLIQCWGHESNVDVGQFCTLICVGIVASVG
jgi:hypothetical protein